MRAVNFSRDNLPVQWQYVNSNLKQMGIWENIEFKARGLIKELIQSEINNDFDATIASRRYQRTNSRVDYRSGYYRRDILTRYGRVRLKMPKARRTSVKYGLFKTYQRRQPEFDEHILKAMVLGLTSRRQKKFFKSFIGDSVSHTTASRIMNKLVYLVNTYRNAPLGDEYEYLYLDAIWVHVKELGIKSRPILIALGVRADGSKRILAFKLAESESEVQWLGLVNDLYRRGLKGLNLNLVISDNCEGLKSAINYVYPYVALQLCTVHKMRNILSKIRNKIQNRKKIMRQASKVFKSKTKKEAVARYNKFIRDWSGSEPGAVRAIKQDIEYYFTYFNFPADKRSSLKSTNPLERINRELRKISRRCGYFQNQRSLDIFTYLTLKEEGLIIDRSFEVMPEARQGNVSLEFANKS